MRWRQWADEQLQQRPVDAAAQPLPAGLADNMSPEVAAAVQRQEPFIRRPPSSAAQHPAVEPSAAEPAAEAQPVSEVHLSAEVLTACKQHMDATPDALASSPPTLCVMAVQLFVL